MKWCVVENIFGVDIGIVHDQQFPDIDKPAACGHMQGSQAILRFGSGIDIGAVGDQDFSDLRMAFSGGGKERLTCFWIYFCAVGNQ